VMIRVYRYLLEFCRSSSICILLDFHLPSSTCFSYSIHFNSWHIWGWLTWWVMLPQILVYEFMSNGNLHDHLLGEDIFNDFLDGSITSCRLLHESCGRWWTLTW
jgi:hypothetical protein